MTIFCDVTFSLPALNAVLEAVSVAARAEIALALADYYSALDQPARAIPYLVDARRRGSERQDIAKALVVAYLRIGDTAAATQVRREAELKES